MCEVEVRNWTIVPLLTFACDINTIREFEKAWIAALNTDLNIRSPITSKAERKEQLAAYYEDNKEMIQQKHADYYQDNKEIWVDYYKANIQNKRFYCNVCDMSFRGNRDLKRHLDTLKHSYAWLNSLD